MVPIGLAAFALKKTPFQVTVTETVGDGAVPWALADNCDIGSFVVRVIADSKTLNKSVFVYSEGLTRNKVWGIPGRVSGETLARKHVRSDIYLLSSSFSELSSNGAANTPKRNNSRRKSFSRLSRMPRKI